MVARILLFFVLGCFLSFRVSFAAVEDVNDAVRVLCEIILFMQGRFGRAIALIAIMMFAWKFTTGGIKWQDAAILAIGIGMLFAPKTMALYILPTTITGVEGSGFVPTQTYTPDELISFACPELR